MLSRLIEALTILLKYGDPDFPTHCEHDELMICDIKPEDVSKEDILKLDELGFVIVNSWDGKAFISYRYGSA